MALCSLSVSEVRAQSGPIHTAELGSFAIQNFDMQEYDGHAQNWAVVQDSSGLIYVANGSGVLEYDGTEWRAIETAGRTAARSLAVDDEGTVYVGTHGDFGYLAPDSTGLIEYVSLMPLVSEEKQDFSEVWRVVTTSDGVYFSSRERLFRWSEEDGVTSWDSETMFALGFEYNDAFYTVEPGTGLVRINGDELLLAQAGEALSDDIIDFALPHGEDSVLLAARNGGFLQYDGTELTPFETEVDAELKRDMLYHGTVMPDGRLALATRRGGMYLLDAAGQLLRTIDEESGLRDQHLWYAYADTEGGLWLALNNGIARVDLASSLSFFTAENDLPGIVMDITRHGGDLYASTSTGTYKLSPSARAAPRFEPVIEGDSGQCLTLLSTEAGLLAGCEGGVYEVRDGGSPRLVTNDVTRLLYQSPQYPKMVLAATRDDLRYLRQENGRWHSEEAIENVPGWALSMEKAGEDTLWLTTTANGVARVTGLDVADPVVDYFGTEQGLPAGWTYVTTIDGALRFHTQEGVLQFDPETEHFVVDDTIREHLAEPDESVFLLQEDRTGHVWFTNNSRLGRLTPSDSGWVAQTDMLRHAQAPAFQTIFSEDDGTIWFGGEGGIVRYAPRNVGAGPGKNVQIRSVSTINEDALIFSGAGQAPSPRLASTENALRFSFSLPTYGGTDAARYQVYLDGFDQQWSAWSGETMKDYTNLPSGQYVFRVRASDAYGQISNEGSFSFQIVPPWYETWWAYLIFGMAAVGFFGAAAYGSLRYRTRRLTARNERLEKEVNERTQTLKNANERLEQVLAQNNEFLSIAAHDLKNPLMSIIGFSELLIAGEISKSDRDEFLSLIYEGAVRMHGTILELQETDLLEKGKLTLNTKRVNVTDLAEAVVRRNMVQADAKSIALHFAAESSVYAIADEDYLPRIIDNLLNNAIKFSASGTSVWLRLHSENDRAVIIVEDEGPGFTDADREQMFEKSQRLSAKPTRGESTTGLGLYIVNMLVKLHDGKLQLDTEPGQGTTFTITLPASATDMVARSREKYPAV